MQAEPRAHLEGDHLESRPGGTAVDNAKPDQPGDDWLLLARQAFDASTSWLEANVRRQWERNLANFRSRHPSGSKYYSESYKHRSKLFRPKTRSMCRSHEAALAGAFFSTADVVEIAAEDDSNPDQLMAADLMHEIVNYRLKNSVPWFLTCMGAFQDTETTGVCVSHQYWEYEERERTEEIVYFDEMTGQTSVEKVTVAEVVKDRPVIELIPAENIRISPAAEWTDPVNTSPYLIHLLPMYVHDVMERIERGADRKTGEPAWRKLPKSMLFSGESQAYDSTRQAREGRNRTDSKDDQHGEPDDYSIVWIHRNILRRDGRDWLYYTVGTHILLSDPVPLADVYLHAEDERPYVLGCSVLEAHRPYPSAVTELTQDTQAMANEIANQRIDNVRFAMNKRYFIREGSRVDVRALLRSVPGGVVRTMDPQNDIKVDEIKDVTASSYEEQDRLNVDFDDLGGLFSTGSVQSNRALNETVGGMQLMAGGATQILEYAVRLFAETWVEPVLRQLVRMERQYETDDTILAVAANKLGLMEQIDPTVFDHNLNVSVNVGMGALSPVKKVERFAMGMGAIAQFAPQVMQYIEPEEVIKEVFGQLGYQDGKRFFRGLEQYGQMQPDPQAEAAAADAQQKAELKAAELQQRAQIDAAKMELERDKTAAQMDLQRELKYADLVARLTDSAADREDRALQQVFGQKQPQR